jgi:hypothetical protein
MECCREVVHAGRVLAPDNRRLHEAACAQAVAHAIPPDLTICYIVKSYIGEGERAMKAFIAACLATVALAAIALVVLNHVQDAADQAFATPYARVD